MAENLDIKDQKLLYYLSQNARESHTQLAKAVGLSKAAITYRIERLQTEGIIKKFTTVINIGSIQHDTFIMLCRFNEDIYTNTTILDYFKTHHYCNWAATLSGQWDIIAEFVIKDTFNINQTLDALTKAFEGKVNNYHIFCPLPAIKVEHLPEDYYKHLNLKPLPSPQKTMERYTLDQQDKKLLHALSEDASQTYVELVTKTKLTPDTVHYRLPKLIDKGIIIKFFPELNLPKLGYTEYFCTLQLRNISETTITTIKQTLRTHQNITFAFKDRLSSSIGFVCAFKKAEELDHLLRNLRSTYTNNIQDLNYVIIKEQILFNLFPKGLLES